MKSVLPLKHQQIKAELVSLVSSGAYQVGDKFPTESALAETFRASRSTIIRALKAIEEEGLIQRRQGSGSFVALQPANKVPVRTAVGILRAAQTRRFPDSIADQIQNRLSTLLQQRGSALISHTIEEGDDPVAVARKLTEQAVNGFFFVPIPPQADRNLNQPVLDLLASTKKPIVLLDGDYLAPPARSNFDVVGIENRRAGFMQTEHLLKLNLRRVLFLGSAPAEPNVTERQLGYQDAMRSVGINVPSEWMCGVDSAGINETFVADLIRQHAPDGIVCKSDEYAALLMRNLHNLGVRIPQDLKVVGFDDRPIASLLSVALTTVRQPIDEIAQTAMHLMDVRQQFPLRAASRIQISASLVVRQSTGG